MVSEPTSLVVLIQWRVALLIGCAPTNRKMRDTDLSGSRFRYQRLWAGRRQHQTVRVVGGSGSGIAMRCEKS